MEHIAELDSDTIEAPELPKEILVVAPVVVPEPKLEPKQAVSNKAEKSAPASKKGKKSKGLIPAGMLSAILRNVIFQRYSSGVG